MAQNANLHAAKAAKNDEFYTQLTDIEKELKRYRKFLKGKIVYCNCDDPSVSEFTHFFLMNFVMLGIKKLICVGYKENGHGICGIYEGFDTKDGNYTRDGYEMHMYELKGDGDFRSDESISFLKECDVVITNPPFSLFREYVAQLIDYNKKFLIIGNMNAITYKEIFHLIKDNKIWLGCNSPKEFILPSKETQKFGNIIWYTNIEHHNRYQPLDLYKTYLESEYPKYDNYDAIEVSKVVDIPIDYDGVMGVPISFLDKYCPEQFEIIGAYNYSKDYDGHPWNAKIDGKYVYKRILIRKK